MGIWEIVCKKFGIGDGWYNQTHWIYRDDCEEIAKCYEELYVERCNQVIMAYLQEVI